MGRRRGVDGAIQTLHHGLLDRIEHHQMRHAGGVFAEPLGRAVDGAAVGDDVPHPRPQRDGNRIDAAVDELDRVANRADDADRSAAGHSSDSREARPARACRRSA